MFNYSIGQDFFEDFKHSPISRAAIRVKFTLDKKTDFFYFNFDIVGSVETECDRCLELFDLPVEGKYKVIVKYTETQPQTTQEEHDLIFISPHDTHFDIRQLLYEYINLSVPIQRTHPIDKDGNYTCSNDVVNILNRHQQSKTEKKSDPRWDALNKLKK